MADKKAAVAHNSKKGARIFDEFAMLIQVQKTKYRITSCEQIQVHLIFKQNARVIGLDNYLAVDAGAEILAVGISGNRAACSWMVCMCII